MPTGKETCLVWCNIYTVDSLELETSGIIRRDFTVPLGKVPSVITLYIWYSL